MRAVPVLVRGARASRHKGLLVDHSRKGNDAAIQIRMIADPAVDQRDSNASAGIVRLPREGCVDGNGGIAERWRQGPVAADVDDIRLVREAQDPIAIELSDDAVNQRQGPKDRAPEFHDITYQTIDEAEERAAIHLRSWGILHDYLYLLRR